MNRTVLRIFRWTAKKAQAKWHEAAVEMVILAMGFFLAFKKLFEFSLTNWSSALLAPYGIERRYVEIAVICLAFACLYAALAKTLLVVLDKLKVGPLQVDGAHRLAQCCLTVSDEDRKDCGVLARVADSNKARSRQRLLDRREEVLGGNLTHLLMQMNAHFCDTIPRCKETDVFISVYVADKPESGQLLPRSLRLLAHHPRKDGGEIASEVVLVQDKNFEEYECVKALKAGRKSVALSSCRGYFRSNSHRHKNIEHYVGLQLLGCERVIGFVNIEFSNHLFFVTDSELREYMSANMLGFKYLIEHHLMRREFNGMLVHLPSTSRGAKRDVEASTD